MRHVPFDSAGRKNKSIFVAFAFSLSLHGLVLFFLARDVGKGAAVELAFKSQRATKALPTTFEVHLAHAPTKQPTLVQSRSKHSLQADKSLATLTNHSVNAQKSTEGGHSTLPKLIDLRTGNQLSLSYWRGVKIQGSAIRIQFSVNPAGFLMQWKVLTKTNTPFQLDPEAMNYLVRNMDALKTGETHLQIWECQIGKKNGELVAKMYPINTN